MTIRGDLDGAIRAAWARPGTVKALARRLEVPADTIKRHARAMGLPPDGPRRALRARAVALVVGGLPGALVARHFGVSLSTVRRAVAMAQTKGGADA